MKKTFTILAALTAILSLWWFLSPGERPATASVKPPSQAPAKAPAPALAEVTVPLPQHPVQPHTAAKVQSSPWKDPTPETIPGVSDSIGIPIMMMEAGNYYDAGTKTAQSAEFTIRWAMANGDIDKLEKLIVIPTEARKRLDALVEKAPENHRKEIGTAERLAAALLLTGYNPPRGHLVSMDAVVDENNRKLNVRYPNGTGQLDLKSEQYQRNAEGEWRRVITLHQANKWSQILNSDLYLAAVKGKQ